MKVGGTRRQILYRDIYAVVLTILALTAVYAFVASNWYAFVASVVFLVIFAFAPPIWREKWDRWVGSEPVERRHLPKWRVIGSIALTIAVVGPLLYGMFYSYFTKTDPTKDIASAAQYAYPFLPYAVLLILILGVYDLYRRYR